MNLIANLNQEIIACRRCPRLVEWREDVARVKRKSFEDWEYWGRPIPIFGDSEANRLIVGLAPAAHGANRTGRMFTGDRSGDWLFRALFRAGVASQPDSVNIEDGLTLFNAVIAATCHCAPPDNKPLPTEISECSRYLSILLESRKWVSVLCLGGIAWDHVHRLLGLPRSAFGHGKQEQLPTGGLLISSYHPSQQNTFTGRLTEEMLDEVVGLWAAGGSGMVGSR